MLRIFLVGDPKGKAAGQAGSNEKKRHFLEILLATGGRIWRNLRQARFATGVTHWSKGHSQQQRLNI